MDQKIRCANRNCRRLFLPNPRVKNHQFCDREGCQRMRKNFWQRQKMKDDPEYQKDQQESQQCWVEQNHDYWRKYRGQHPEYVERNRRLQNERDKKRRSGILAKMDSLNQESYVSKQRIRDIPQQPNVSDFCTSRFWRPQIRSRSQHFSFFFLLHPMTVLSRLPPVADYFAGSCRILHFSKNPMGLYLILLVRRAGIPRSCSLLTALAPCSRAVFPSCCTTA